MNYILYLKILTQILIALENIFLKSLLKMKKRLIIIIFFQIDDKSVVISIDFKKKIGTLYDLLIYLLDNSINLIASTQNQLDFL